MADSETSVPETPVVVVPSNVKKRVTVRFDSSYVRKKGGITKLVEISLSFLGFLCIQCTYLALHSTGKWFSTVAMLAVCVTGILLFCYLFHFVEKFVRIPWAKFQLFFCAIISPCFIIASWMAAPMENTAFQAAAFFGFCAAIVYAFDAYSSYLLLKSNFLGQDEKEVNKEVDSTIA